MGTWLGCGAGCTRPGGFGGFFETGFGDRSALAPGVEAAGNPGIAGSCMGSWRMAVGIKPGGGGGGVGGAA